MNARELQAMVDGAFAEVPRPDHFTNHLHCGECAEHDETLRAFDRDTIGLEQLGRPGWDPICFVSTQAFLYYFPAMVRLALASKGAEGYLDQFLFHMTYEGRASRFFRHFSRPRRRAVLEVLRYVREHMGVVVKDWGLEGELEEALQLWTSLGPGD